MVLDSYKINTLLSFLNDEGNEIFKMAISTRQNAFLLCVLNTSLWSYSLKY